MTTIARSLHTGPRPDDRPVIAIIGGGFTGATLALHLARDTRAGAARIFVIEPRAQIGAGLAYSTRDPSHRTNVPASRMTIDTARRGDFLAWIEENDIQLSPGTQTRCGAIFPQRGLFGRYAADRLRPMLESGRVQHLCERAVAVRPGRPFAIRLGSGQVIHADHLVIATSHPPPGIPAVFAGLKGDPRLLTDPSDPGPITATAQATGDVLIVGTGLTSADVIASLDRQGFAGRITAISRRGLRSRGHAIGCTESRSDFTHRPETTALGVLRRIRRAVRSEAARGLPWQAVLDNVRRDGAAIWAALPLAERARLVRRLRVWWDVHRFRIAPQLEAVLDDLGERGRLNNAAGRIEAARATPEGIAVRWTPRGARPREDIFGRVILTTGPDHGAITASNPVIAGLSTAGLLRADPLGLGLDVTDTCRAVGGDDRPTPGLWIAGPLARAHIGELMGIPEVTMHAEAVAAMIAAEVATATPRVVE
ncbi:MAG: FAD/NAD(P)-binding protein [Paracoccus sp. (in: a-proteobacteria)]|nr:FAD/NAD(P)-binding protein [Paracoccus sp. (in: a-proteobacteria)]